MATATAAWVETSKSANGSTVQLTGTLDFDTGDYTTGGVPVTIPKPGTTKSPLFVKLYGTAGYVYEYDITNSKVMIFIGNYDSTDGPLIEHTVAQLASAISTDPIKVCAVFPKFG